MLEIMILALIFMVLVHFLIKKKYNIVTTSFIYRHQTPTQKRVEWSLVGLFTILIIILAQFLPTIYLYAVLFAHLSIFSGYRAYMEYKHEREAKQYFLNLYWSFGYFILFLLILIFN